MEDLNFMTIGRSKNFIFVNYSTKQLLKLYPNCKFFIYDWGFTVNQKKVLKSYPITELIKWDDKINWREGYRNITEKFEGYLPPKNIIELRQNEYIMNQKPVCILDCSKRIKNNLVYLDGDALLVNKIDELLKKDFDIGVTIRPKNEIESAKKLDIYSEINAGVIFFLLDSERMKIFIDEWIKEINQSNRIWQDQTCLITLINRKNKEILRKYYNAGTIKINTIEIKVKALPCIIYNLYTIEKNYDFKNVKILHFKGRIDQVKIKKIILEIKVRYVYNSIIKLFPNEIRKKLRKDINIQRLVDFIANRNKLEKLKKFSTKVFQINKLIKNFYHK